MKLCPIAAPCLILGPRGASGSSLCSFENSPPTHHFLPGHPLDERVVRLLVPPPGQIRCVTRDSFQAQSSALILVAFSLPGPSRSKQECSRSVQEASGAAREAQEKHRSERLEMQKNLTLELKI